MIVPQFEKNDILNNIKFQEESLAGPGNILMTNVQRAVDGQKNDPFEIKTLKYNK